MGFLQFGPAPGLPAGYALCPAGTLLYRGHTPGLSPNWFGPALGKKGGCRWDVPLRGPGDPGVCYFAPTLEGVILERVLRDHWRPEIDLENTKQHHALSRCIAKRDLVLLELMQNHYTVHKHQISEVTSPDYTDTQRWAEAWAKQTTPLMPDGIAYGSRFSSTTECIALWDRAAGQLDWHGSPEPFGTDDAALETACKQLGLHLKR